MAIKIQIEHLQPFGSIYCLGEEGGDYLNGGFERRQAKQSYSSLQRHSSGNGGIKSELEMDYDNVDNCRAIGGGGGGSIVVHGDSGDSGVIVRESRPGRTMGDGMGEYY